MTEVIPVCLLLITSMSKLNNILYKCYLILNDDFSIIKSHVSCGYIIFHFIFRLYICVAVKL